MSHAQMRYHPQVGFVYMPNARLRISTPQGGYLVRTNLQGFRSDYDFVTKKSPGTFRVMLFGDSQTAGDGNSNSARYSDLLEKAIPGLQIHNHGLSGTGPDQHYLAWQEHSAVEHDLLIIALYLENIRRVTRRIIKSIDVDGRVAFYAKPYFELRDGQLFLHNVPVPKQPWTEATLPAEQLPHVYGFGDANFLGSRHPTLRRLTAFLPMRGAIKQAAMSWRNFQPLPEYDDADNPDWLLLRAILAQWIAASRSPVLLMPIPHYAHITADIAPGGYPDRLAELARQSGCRIFDPLPRIGELSAKDRRALWSDACGHLSRQGHELLAKLLEPVLREFATASA